jgi:glucose-6-phosphate isomerase
MLSIDYANCLTDRIDSHGLDPASLSSDSPSAAAVREITGQLEASRGAGWERWRQLPFDPMRSAHLEEVRALTDSMKGRFDNLVVLGIGGSALGNTALQCALNPPTWNLLPNDQRNGPRLFVLDNVDPSTVSAMLDYLARTPGGLDRTLFNVVSKSGQTAETAAQFLIIHRLLVDALGQHRHAEHIVAITDPESGTMRSICDVQGYTTLPVPEGVGGRFSVLSPVGLFSAAMCNIDIEALLTGAGKMDQRCSSPDLSANPAAMLATLLVRLAQENGKNIHVLMPYSNALFSLADWFRQLWAESLGKRVNATGAEVFAGFTPVKALGATDQHSQIQLYREGPNDKIVGFIEIENTIGDDPVIPAGLDVEELRYLQGSTLGELLHAEKRATEFALVESQRPNFTIRMPKLDAHHVGEFLQLWMVATAFAGRMLRIDAYNQPAVETGKQATFGLMGRAGYEKYKSKVDAALGKTPFVI